MKASTSVLVVSFLALFFGTIAYWALVWSLVDPEAWMARFPYVSPLADTWMAGTGLVAAVGLLRRRGWGVVSGYLSAGACVFVAITAFHFNVRTDAIARLDAWQLVETLVPGLLLLLGVVALALLPLQGRGVTG